MKSFILNLQGVLILTLQSKKALKYLVTFNEDIGLSDLKDLAKMFSWWARFPALCLFV